MNWVTWNQYVVNISIHKLGGINNKLTIQWVAVAMRRVQFIYTTWKQINCQDKKAESPKPTAPLTMEIDPHLRQLQEQAKMFSRFNSATDPQPEREEKEPRKQCSNSNVTVPLD